MGNWKKRKCCYCGQLYEPDLRNLRHQRHCSSAACRAASKRRSQGRWLSKPENRGYFCGPEHVGRVRQWRAEHPGYWRRGAKAESALQDDCRRQGTETTQQSGRFMTTALQDVLASQGFVLIGLIAKLVGVTLQDDIALAGRNLVRLGQDILGGVSEASAMPGAASASAESVQLGRSTPGP